MDKQQAGKSAHETLVAAGNAQAAILQRAQRILTMYLEPGDLRIQSPAQCVDAMLRLFDGPEQRKAQQAWAAALASSTEEAA